jgi:hypothetical protein
MDFVIRFIGIVMIVSAVSSTVLKKDIALVPMSGASNSFCSGIATVVQHEAFIRVNTGQIVDDKDWPGGQACDASQGCTLYSIPVASDLSIAPGFTPAGTGITEDTTYCLIPQMRHELRKLGHQYDNLDLTGNPIAATLASLDLPPGKITAFQFPHTAMATSVLWVTAPGGSQVTPITITADARDHSVTRKLVVRAGSNIAIVNLPHGQAGLDFGMKHGSPEPPMKGHMFLYNNLVSQEFCTPIAEIRDTCPSSVVQIHPDSLTQAERRAAKRRAAHGGGPGEGTDSLCSNTGCCRP